MRAIVRSSKGILARFIYTSDMSYHWDFKKATARIFSAALGHTIAESGSGREAATASEFQIACLW